MVLTFVVWLAFAVEEEESRFDTTEYTYTKVILKQLNF